ncbi:hypothetical protein KDA82_40965, partial [Streptomyces daliensis]|nr:hypothetical protein [Streptomyces daliensis]
GLRRHLRRRRRSRALGVLRVPRVTGGRRGSRLGLRRGTQPARPAPLALDGLRGDRRGLRQVVVDLAAAAVWS